MKPNNTLAERVLALLLALVTATTLVPAPALAEAVDELAATPQAEAAAEEQPAEDAPASDDVAADTASDVEQEPAADEEPAEKVAPKADAAVEQPAVVAPTAVTATGKADAPAVASADTLTSDAKVYIQESKDKNNSYSTKSGALKVGETLWANVYEGYSSVTNPGTWTYTWLAGTVKASNDVSDYTEVVGHEQSLTVTDVMVSKYFICKVTAGGKDYYGPSVSYGSGINANYIPGPVLGAGQANLYSVKLSSSSPAVGDTLTATPYTAYNTPAASDTKVTYAWYESTNKYSGWAEIEGATTASLTLTDALEGKYVKVKANAGVNDVEATTSDAVLKAGAVKLAGVELSASSTEIGATLTAKAYTGSSYSPSYVDNSKVTYTWKKFKGTSAPSSSTKWETIEGESGPTLTVADDLEGYYVSVSANAGANDVSFGGRSTGYGVGPFKQAGAVDIYSALLAPEGSTSGTYVYTVDDTVQALAKEKGASDYIDASKLSYQWQIADAKGGTYTDIEGATSNTLELTAYEGKSVRCHITAKIGSSDYTTKGTSLIGASGSVNITKITLDRTVEAKVGEKITATAKSGSDDVTSSPKVTWSWYCGDSPSTCVSKIEGADTNSFTPDAALANKYVQARANGGFGDEQSSTLPVVEAGAVDLYGVTVTGALASGQIAAGKVLTAKATKGNSYTDVSATDTVHYQWQYSNDKSSYDSHFVNIPDATDSATYTPTADMVGKYIRVIATSKNSVKSTEKKSTYGGTQSVGPVGPVTLAGQYELKSVAPNEASSTTLSVGAVLTPRVKIPGSSSWSDSDLPEDAKLTLAWYAKGEGDSDWAELTEGIDAETGALTLSDSLVGKRIKLTASALDNAVEWVSTDSVTAAGEYNLLRVTTTPQINSDSTHLVSGDSVKATVQAKRADGSTTNGIDVTAQTTVAWYAADDAKAPAADWTLLPDMSGATATVSASAAGKYLKAVATSGNSTAELVSANTVIAAGSLEAAVQKLNDANKQIAVDYSVDGGNVNDVLKAQLAELGFDDVDVKVSEGGVLFKAEDAKATIGISDAQDKTNGDVTFFYIDPNDYAGYNIDGLRSADVVFELSRGGETEYYQPNKTVQIAWNEARVQELLDNAAEQIAVGYASGDSAESVTSNLTLPYRAGSKSKFEVEWKSSDGDAIWPSGYGWSDYTGKVTRASSDREVTLTATVSFVSGGPSGIEGAHDFTVTVKGDPEKVAADKKALQEKVDAAFTYDNIKYSGTDTVANKDGLTDDLQMPRTSTLGVDGKYYKVEYSASTDDVTFNGYKGTVYRPEAGKDAVSTKLTCTVTDKNNPEVTATKTLDFTIAPQDQADLETELKLMEAAKAGYAEAILDGQDASGVTANMHAFQNAYLDADGKLAWSYDKATADAAGSGIVSVELEGASESAGYRLFKSSRPDLLKHENLVLGETPEYNTKVTVTSRLSSEKYARYAERYPDNPTYAKLANQDVSATVAIKGSTGLDDPNEGKAITVTAQVTGPDTEGNDADWVPQTEVTIPAGETMTAAALTKQVLEQHGMTCDDGMYTISAKDGTLPNGQTSLGSAQDSQGNWRWWVLYINGKQSNLLAVNYYVKAGDKIEWVFGDGSVSALPHTVTFNTGEGSAVDSQFVADGAKATKPADPTRDGYVFAGWYADADLKSPYDFSASVTKDLTLYAKWVKGSYVVDGVIVDPSAEGPNWDSDWSGFTSADKVTEAPVPTEDAEAKWVATLKNSSEWNTSVSDPLLVGDYVYIAVGSKLYKKNVDTGETAEGGEAALVSAIDSTSRMVYTDGLILVPLSSGRLQALTVDTLTTKWVTDALPDGTKGSQQSLSSVTVRDDYAYFGSADADWSNSYGGYLLCVRLSDGKVMWNKANQNSVGYYWSGMAFAGGYGVIADDSGTVSVVDPATGDVVSTLKVADRVRTTVLADGSTLYVASNDGVLHKLSVAADGTLSEASSVKFGASSTSTPVLANGKIIVGGTSVDGFTGGWQGNTEYHYGQIAVIDAATMKVENAVCKADGNYIRQYGYDAGGDVKSQPVVSVQDGQTYVYFTSNNNPGGIYRYRVGDEEAELLYTPGTANQNYCMSSISVGSDGSLYYTNDSGKLFAIKGNGERLKRFTVTFDANGKDAELPASQRVKQGHPAIEPSAKPRCAGFTFVGWYRDAACTQAWDFAKDVVTADMTLYAKWSAVGGASTGDTNKADDAKKDNASGGQTSLSGNGGKKTTLAITLRSNVSAESGESEEKASLLSGFTSGEATGAVSTTAAEGAADLGADAGFGSSESGDQLPIWPFIGMAVAAAALIVALLAKRGKGDEE
ncbi:InlB B-repeat-containing protein [Paratractidigestivibacter faecalis]|uniref:InlB B-repeat-containing protein n=1 Tax=Paratractidigestivibacter faecalis TaxID=2292441 RepID=A0ABV1IFF2_9ACTN